MQDPKVPHWGALDRFMAHFIVQTKAHNTYELVAKTILTTKGHFGGKKVVSVKWDGGFIANILNKDSKLNKLIAKQHYRDAQIFIDPTDTGIRLYSTWKNAHDFTMTKELFEIYDKIAGHIKNL